MYFTPRTFFYLVNLLNDFNQLMSVNEKLNDILFDKKNDNNGTRAVYGNCFQKSN